jgi:hypothetical protein
VCDVQSRHVQASPCHGIMADSQPVTGFCDRFLRQTCQPNAFKKIHKRDCNSVTIQMQPYSSALVPKYRFDTLEHPSPGCGEVFKVTDIQTGRVAYQSLSTTANKGIIAKLRDVFVPAAASIEEPATAVKSKATKIRTFTPQHKYNILTEALHGNHTRSDGAQIQFQDRNKHGNCLAFFASICRVLNDGQSYPSFAKSKAVESSVRSWIDTAMGDRVGELTRNLGEDFHLHADFMGDEVEDLEEHEDNPNSEFYFRKNIELIDFLIHLDKIHEPYQGCDHHDRPPTHTSDQEDEMIQGKVDGVTQGVAKTAITGDEGEKRKKRKHKLENPREKKTNPVVQLQEQQSNISSMLDKLLAFNADPIVTSSSAPADPAIQSIRSSLLQHATPPGTVSVCEKLADSLAGYGFCSFQELLEFRPRSDARKILSDLKWSPLQIKKVLGDSDDSG